MTLELTKKVPLLQLPIFLTLLFSDSVFAQIETPLDERRLAVEGETFFNDLSGRFPVVANRGEVVAGDSSGGLLSFPVTENLPDSVPLIPVVPQIDLGGVNDVLLTTTGLRSFLNVELRESNEDVIMQSAIGPDGSKLPVTFHRAQERTTGGGRFRQLVSAGDYVMWSANRWQDGEGFVEIYRTLPELQFEQVLRRSSVPSDRNQSNFGYRMTADENVLVVGNRPFGNEPITLSIFERTTGSAPWVLRDVERVPSRNQGSDYQIDTDGRTLALLYWDQDSIQKIKMFSRSENGGFIEEQDILREDIHPELTDTTLSSFAVDSGQIVVTSNYQSETVGGTAAFHVLEEGEGTWESKGFLLSDFRGLSTQFVEVSGGFVYGTEGNLITRFDIRNSTPPRPDFVGLPVLQAAANGVLRDQLNLKGDLPSITPRIVEGPSWLSLSSEDGNWILGGTAPPATGTESVHLELTDGQGRIAMRTYELEILPPSATPEVTEIIGEADLREGEELLLNAKATGAEPLNFQWFKDGVLLDGETSNTLEVINAFPDDAGSYSVVVSNAAGSAESGRVEITVGEATREAGDWPTFGNAPSHRGHHPASLETHFFVPKWEVSLPESSAVERAVIAEGKVFVTHFDRDDWVNLVGAPAKVFAYEVDSGQLIWERDLGRAITINPPTYHNGRLYVQRSNRVDFDPDSQLISLDADTGETIWSSPFEPSGDKYEAPVVTDEGIWIHGGKRGGLIGINLDGSRRFENGQSILDSWTPSYHNGRLFFWVAGLFKEVNPLTGEDISITGQLGTGRYSGSSFNSVAAITSRGAVLRAAESLFLFDFENLETVWEVPVSGPLNSPAIFDETIFLNQGREVRTFDFRDGSAGLPYNAPEEITSSQPLLLNNRLLVASESSTFVFDMESRELLQTLPAGGELSYSNGTLAVAGEDGKLSIFFANDVPDLLTIDLEDAVENIELDQVLSVDHDDDGETITFRKISGPDWLTVSNDGRLGGSFGNIPAERQTLVVEVTDGVTPPVQASLSFNMIAVNDPPEVTQELGQAAIKPAADPVSLNLNELFNDPDPGDSLVFSISGNSEPSLFSSLSIDPDTGFLNAIFAPYQEGSSNVSLRATDREGVFVEQTVSFDMPELPLPSAVQVGEITLNRRTGLFEQTVTVSNSAQRAIGGFELLIEGLSQVYSLYGLSSNHIHYLQEVGPGEQVTLVLEYHSPITRTPPNPALVTAKALPSEGAVVAVRGVEPSRITPLADRSMLLEFATTPGARYQVLYSTDMEIWRVSPVTLVASANRTLWIDRGLPKTDCPPSECPMRFYRIDLIE